MNACKRSKPTERRHACATSVIALVVAGVAATVTSPGLVGAQGNNVPPYPGDGITVLIPVSSNQPEPDPGPPTDMLVFTGRSLGTVNVAGCSTGEFPIQRAVLVDPDGGRASRNLEVVNITVLPQIPPGTRLRSFAFQTICSAGGVLYKRHTAVVE